jgi:hypothetical protein
VKVKRRFSQIHTFLFISFGGLPETWKEPLRNWDSTS